ncbi:MAG: c-type cytochrome, partial [Solirubrobacterales bacterium]|nr:c-type cytochrome [Solirubrobacterales bacterium]
LTALATIGVPTICMILLFLLPFYDRNPERRPERRPVATLAGIFTIIAIGYLTYLGAEAGSPNEIETETPERIEAQGGEVLASFEAGRIVTAQSGCLACHKIGSNGGTIGPDLTDVGERLPAQAIARTLENPTEPMPAYDSLQAESPEQFEAMVAFLSLLREDE